MSPIRPDRRVRAPSTIGLAAAGAILLIATAAQAAPSGNQKALPINIQANNANFTQKTGVSTYTGNVSMTRGGLTLTGDKLVVTRINKDSPVQAVLTGNPAHIDRKPDANDNEHVTGHARRIEYTNGTSVITLRGSAVVNRGGDQIQGAVITHDVDTGETHAERGSGQDDRVHITIQPGNAGNGNR